MSRFNKKETIGGILSDAMDAGIFIFIGVLLITISMFGGLFAVLAFLFKTAWNLLMPAILGLPEIGFWQGVGAVILISFVARIFSGRSTISIRRY